MKIILASSSPRRSKLMAEEGFQFEVKPPQIAEKRLDGEPAEEYVCRLAKDKAQSVANGNSFVVGADTVVVIGDEFLNKPSSRAEAIDILRKLSGKTHTVFTGVSVICPVCGRIDTAYDRTEVQFNVLTDKAILEYIKTGEPMDKAGAYGIQGMGSFLVKEISGELDTVIGLPRKLLRKLVEEHRECLDRA